MTDQSASTSSYPSSGPQHSAALGLADSDSSPPRSELLRRVAEAIAVAADDCYAFEDEHGDPEMWEARAEDRDYWTRLAEAALAVADAPEAASS